jgi:5-methylcytosine-specific restriction endonuclease McrA
VLRLDRALCVTSGHRATVVDHLLPEAWGGSDQIVNLRAMCGRCHRAKTQDESRLGRQMAAMSGEARMANMTRFLEVWR